MWPQIRDHDPHIAVKNNGVWPFYATCRFVVGCGTGGGFWARFCSSAFTTHVIVLCVCCVLIGVYCGGPHGQFRQNVHHPRNIYHENCLGTGGARKRAPPCIQGEVMATVAWVVSCVLSLRNCPQDGPGGNSFGSPQAAMSAMPDD